MKTKKLHAETIEEVISIMDDIIDDCFAARSRLGFFTAMYRATTIVVKERCDAGNFFEDNDRMRKLDVIFANRYFQSYKAYMQAETPTSSWGISFEMAENTNLMILQHLLMGMNAHISLDLGISAAEIAVEAGELSPSLERDFLRLNNILANLIDIMQDEIASVSPLLRYLDWLGGPFDEKVVSVMINAARDEAWKFAQELVLMPQSDWEAVIQKRDTTVSAFSRSQIANLGFPLGLFVRFVKLRESRDNVVILEALSNENWATNVRDRVYKVLRHAKEFGIDLASRDTQLIKIPKEFSA